MTFPQTPLETVVELLIDGGWTDITAEPVYGGDRSRVETTRGRQSEDSSLTPADATFQLNNRSGDFSPRNPTGAHYGKIGRNTPCRISVGTPHPAASNWDDVDTTDQVAPAVVSPTDDAILLCAWAAPDTTNTYTVPGSMTSSDSQQGTGGTIQGAYEDISSSGTTGTRTATYGAAEDYVAASVLLHGTSVSIRETEGDSDGSITTNSGTADGDWVVVFSYMATDAADTVFPGNWDDDVQPGGWIRLADTGLVEIDDFDAAYVRMVAWAKRLTVTGTHTLTYAIPSDAICVRSVMFQVSGAAAWSPRFYGEVPSWPQRWDKTGSDVWVDIQAAGIMRRLGQGSKSLRSAIYRLLVDNPQTQPSAYWPLTDGSQAKVPVAAPGYLGRTSPPGQIPIGRTDFAAGDIGPWNEPVLKHSADDARLILTLLNANRYSSTWVAAVMLGGEAEDWQIIIYNSDDGTTQDSFHLTSDASAGKIYLDVIDDTSTAYLDATGASVDIFDEKPHLIMLRCHQVGSDVDFNVYVDGVDVHSDTISSMTLQRPTTTWLTGANMSFGHYMIWDEDVAADDRAELVDAAFGHPGERAGRRIERLCNEEGIPFQHVGDLDDTIGMGPQYSDPLLDLLAECERTDLGILHEPRGLLGLGYRTRASLYNQPPRLTVDYEGGALGTPPEPEDDDRFTRNDVTAERRDGSTVERSLDSGALSTQAPPDGVGVYDEQVTINPAGDGKFLEDQAGWRLHVGTIDEARFPVVHLNLANSVGVNLADDAQGLDIGDRLDITNPPAWLPPDTITQLAQGFVEILGNFGHDLKVNCIPESPYRVAVAESADGDDTKADTAGSSLASDFDAGTDTSMSVDVDIGPLWTTDSSQLPLEIECGGARLTVSAISGSSSPQTFTVSATVVNGVEKTIPAGTAVRLWQPAILAL